MNAGLPRVASPARGACGRSSVVERQLPKLNVVGSIPIARSKHCPIFATSMSAGLLSGAFLPSAEISSGSPHRHSVFDAAPSGVASGDVDQRS